MNLKRFTLTLLLVTNLTVAAFAQKDTIGLNSIITKTTRFITNYPIEKVYLHLDKPFYAAGDSIWFKAYVTIDKHQPTVLSTIVYVDITNSQDSIMRLIKLPVVNGVASGCIPLTTDYKQGNYHLRAYTGWMRNFDPDYMYNKTISIGNAIETAIQADAFFNTTANTGKVKVDARINYKDVDDLALPNKKVSWVVKNATSDEISKGKGTTDANGNLMISFTGTNASTLQNCQLVAVIEMGNRREITNTFPLKTSIILKDVQFFPEGGELTVGVRSKVAFKAVTTTGMGINVKGTVTDNTGAVVANLSSEHLGMGVFAFMPEEGKSYKANITFADGTQASYDLPRAQLSGINLSVFNNDPVNLNIRLSANETFFKINQNKSYYIIAQNGGAIYFAAQTTLQSQIYSAGIPKSKFPTGLVQLTLFSDRGIPLSERVVFIQHNDMLDLTMAADKKIYSTRQKVKITVSAKNKALPVAGSFSVSVIDESKVPFNENAETTILTNLLLTSEVKGYIEEPNYYFISKDENAAANLDILMLTQGYRRISYNNIRNDRFPQVIVLPEQQGLEVTGMLRNNTGLPIAKGSLRMQIPSKNFYAETISDMTGNFKFSKLAFPDSSQVTISARGNYNSKNLMISVNGETYTPPTHNPNALDAVANIDSLYKPYMLNSKKRYDNLHILKEVTIKSTSAVKKASHDDYPGFAGLPMQADQTITGERVKDCNDLRQCLPSLLLGLTADETNVYFAANYTKPDKKPIQIFLNGKPIDYSYLSTQNPKMVETIEVFKKDGFSGANKTYDSDGLIFINMKKIVSTKISLAEFQEMLPKGNLLNFTAQGYTVSKEFYSPKYDVPKPGLAFGGDLRSTIFWSPKVITDKTTGTTSFEYYNADGRGSYRATIEGFDADGNLGRYILRYTVK
ncbi:carboxypeptidase regulatory-like domain-containing protein [Inquilinus sp. KBS0705]|nr:carboxypeptidase regulatory-like domain-containing protein [Inquilinus sp. KBS0705]